MPTATTGDIETHYVREGEGPPGVFVHGAIVDHTQWRPQLAALSDRYTTVGYDVRGHGRTGGSERERYDVGLFVEDLDALLSALDLEMPVLCGLSMGGCIAQAYAATYPEKLSGIVLADTFSPERTDWRERLQFLMLKATVPPVKLVGYERVEKVLVWLQERIQPGSSGEYDKIEELREEAPKMATAEFEKVIGALTRFHEAEFDIGTISTPTLVLYGQHDASFIQRQSALLADRIPGADLVEVPDAGHAANLDNPEFVTEQLREFLGERARRY